MTTLRRYILPGEIGQTANMLEVFAQEGLHAKVLSSLIGALFVGLESDPNSIWMEVERPLRFVEPPIPDSDPYHGKPDAFNTIWVSNGADIVCFVRWPDYRWRHIEMNL